MLNCHDFYALHAIHLLCSVLSVIVTLPRGAFSNDTRTHPVITHKSASPPLLSGKRDAQDVQRHVHNLSIELVVCRTDNYMSPHGVRDGFEVFQLSLQRINEMRGDSPPKVHNVCKGHIVQYFDEVFFLKAKLMREFIYDQTGHALGQSTVFMLVDASDVVFNQPVSVLQDRFFQLSDGGQKLC